MAKDLNTLKKRRSAIKGWLSRGEKKMTGLIGADEPDVNEIQQHLETFKERMTGLQTVQSEIEELLDEQELDQDIEDEGNFLDQCISLIAKCKTVIEKRKESKKSDATAIPQTHVATPKVQIPKFAGEATEYLPFIQMFESAVHKSAMPSHLKLSILRSHLKGEALNSITLYGDTDENYEPALAVLKKKYGDKDTLVDTYISQLLLLRETTTSLEILNSKLRSIIHILFTLGITSESYAILLVPIIKAALPAAVRTEFCKHQVIRPIEDKQSKLEYLLDFIETQVKIASTSSNINLWKEEDSKDTSKEKKSKMPSPGKKDWRDSGKFGGPLPIGTASFISRTSNAGSRPSPSQNKFKYNEANNPGFSLRQLPPCPFCGNQHHPAQCQEKFNLSPQQAGQIISNSGRCPTCLGLHQVAQCRFPVSCAICGASHHPTLCVNRQRVEVAGPPPSPSLHTQIQHTVTGHSVASALAAPNATPTPCIIQQTATILASATNRPTSAVARVLLDSGSQRSYVTSNLCMKLQPHVVRMDTINSYSFGGNQTGLRNMNVVELSLASRHTGNSVIIQALVTDCISAAQFEPIPVDVLNLLHLQDLVLADEPSLGETPVDILIGLDAYYAVMGSQIKRGPSGPVAVSSLFGWVVTGPTGEAGSGNTGAHLITTGRPSRPAAKLEKSVQDFWRLDSMGVLPEEVSSTEDQLACQLFSESVVYDETTEMYSVGLPWRSDHPPLISNFNQASARYRRLQSTLSDQDKSVYNEALQEFVDHEYVEPAPTSLSGPNEFYLPHRPVKKESSSTYKVRPVFDASACGPNGVSLNSCLYTGPSLIPDLLYVLMRFRQWEIGLIGDLKRAFLQVGIHEIDRDVLRYIWNGAIFRFTRVPFGVSSSPFLLNAVIRHHLERLEVQSDEDYDLFDDMDSNFYVDDYATGASSCTAAVDRASAATRVMEYAGMTLRNWASNSSDVLDTLMEMGIEIQSDLLCSVLGLRWDTTEDTLRGQAPGQEITAPLTKRSILSFISKTFDPLGWCSPITIRGKVLVQKLWISGIGWDDPILDSELVQEAYVVQENFLALSSFSVPRWLGVGPEEYFDVHVFCDASPVAYACVIYVASNRCSQLMVAKTRVTPIKPVLTLPRCELMACLIGARLVSRIQQAVPLLADTNVYCWSDSTIALQWINSTKTKEIFVANRTKEIRNLTRGYHWGHIVSSDNAADLATRSNMTVHSLAGNGLWWHGPDWIIDVAAYPESRTLGSGDVTVGGLESSQESSVLATQIQFEPSVFNNGRGRLLPATRVVAYALRFISRVSIHRTSHL